ncbi:hypothetical protein SDRG_13604 [Saprolegnia diclina VS20]|uniref:Uncharacterized protein n=1 Tax=Saprolegnia diclina (strain VS20) TaxID=1156394 RepID=T0Q5L6_SAPDV|nr:hypothetical protein SDRG_13604 [Saprolegnia diclina VS20]EQC28730.1 hypothetical protein SDRG_13604 [Saprolegnia diclina VS20]|eukprot:XP_008617922.1 hypothetical protein SDRG_13604 [Saprolegnia diclina VS20]
MEPAIFRSVVLQQPDIATIIFGSHDGVPEDVHAAITACRDLVEVDASGCYKYDASFRQAFAPDTEWSNELGTLPSSPYLRRDGQYDDRLPVHMAIVGGFAHLTKRIVRFRPDLASEDAIILAVTERRLEIADLLLNARPTVPELYRRINFPHRSDGSDQRFSDLFLHDMMAKKDVKGLQLLVRFGLRPNDFDAPDRSVTREKMFQRAIWDATVENATLAVGCFPWLIYPRILDDVAGLSLVQTLHERGFECSTAAMDKAAAKGHLEVVQFLHTHRSEGCTVRAMDNAASNGHLEVVQFLHTHRSEGCTVKALDGAIASGHLDVVRFLIEHRSEGASLNILDVAAGYGHLEVVQYLDGLGSFGCTVNAVDSAAIHGHLDLTTYLLSLGYPVGILGVAWDSAAAPEPLDVVQLFVGYGMPWRFEWIEEACAANNVPLIQFFCGHLDDYDDPDDVLDEAIRRKAWDVVRNLLAYSTAEISLDALQSALDGCHFDVATQILRRRPALGDDECLREAVIDQNVEAVRFLLAAGIGQPRDCLVEFAGRRDHVTTSKLLLPYCMDAVNHVDNFNFLLDLVARPKCHRPTLLRVITTELAHQGHKVSQTMQLR